MDSRQAKPTAEQVQQWDEDKLLQWIKDNQPKMLKVAHLEKFQAEEIRGKDFLDHAGDVGFFKNSCGLPAGPSSRLANLAREFAEAGGATAGMKSKLLSSYHAHHVDSKLIASQEKDNRAKMWSCPSANLVSPLHPLSVNV